VILDVDRILVCVDNAVPMSHDIYSGRGVFPQYCV